MAFLKTVINFKHNKKSPIRVGARKGEQERLIYSEECIISTQDMDIIARLGLLCKHKKKRSVSLWQEVMW